MLNMKKGLAIVLAAATALTFAPVSTLGLQGVVEAQAATDKVDAVTISGDDFLIGDTAKDFTVSTTNSSKASEDVGADTDVDVKVFDSTNTDKTSDFAFTKTVGASGSGQITVNLKKSAAVGSKADYTVKVTVNGKTATKTLAVYKDQPEKNAADAKAAAVATKGNIKGVDSNIYIQRSSGSSVNIAPSYVTVNGREESASNYKFTVATTEPTALNSVDSVPVSDITIQNTNKLNIDSPATGSVKLTVDKADTLTAGTPAAAYLEAYKLDSSTGKYTLVAYNAITINPYAVSSDLVLSDDYNNGVSVLLDKSTSGSIFDNAKVFDSKTGTEVKGVVFTVGSASIAFPNEAIAKLETDGKLTGTKLGSETATVTIPYTVGGVSAIATKTLRVNVISSNSSVIKVTADGSKDAATLGTAEAPIRLNVKSNKTFDLSKYVYVSDPANTTIAYKSNNSRNTVSDAGVVNATVAVDQFVVTVQAKDKKTGVVLASTDVYFRVNALPDDVLAVSGASITTAATVLNDTDYAYTKNKVTLGSGAEETLAASQIHYVQFDVTGNEDSDIEKDLHVTSANGAKLTYSIANKKDTGSAFKAISQAGVLTIAKGITSDAAVIKVVSSATANSEVTTSYFYVVIDQADPNVDSMFEAAYKLGTDAGATKNKGYQSDIAFSKDGYTVKAKFLKKSDDKTAAQNLYNLDSVESFNQTLTNSLAEDGVVGIATAEGKTEHVLVSVTKNKGTAYKVITITSVPGVHNSVTKIEDATTGKTVYTPDMGTAVPELLLDGNTTLKVWITYSIDKNATTSDITSTSLYSDVNNDPLNQNIITRSKEKVKKGDTYNTFYLYPTSQGTQTVTVSPSGNISNADHSITYNDDVKLAITYRQSLTLSKVTGLKVANKKGAAVSVSWTKQGTNVLYRVYKKVGSGKWVAKNVAGTKTSLKVKKGAKVTVKVKAYKKTDAGKTVWGPKATKKTFKTDKK